MAFGGYHINCVRGRETRSERGTAMTCRPLAVEGGPRCHFTCYRKLQNNYKGYAWIAHKSLLVWAIVLKCSYKMYHCYIFARNLFCAVGELQFWCAIFSESLTHWLLVTSYGIIGDHWFTQRPSKYWFVVNWIPKNKLKWNWNQSPNISSKPFAKPRLWTTLASIIINHSNAGPIWVS